MTATLLKTKPTIKEAFAHYEYFCKGLLDSFVVIDAHGKPVQCNVLFSQLVGVKSKQVLKADTLEDLIRFEIDGKPLTTDRILDSACPLRIDEVHGRTDEMENLNLIIGLVPFRSDDGELLGVFLSIRDVTAESNLQGKFNVAQSKSITDPLTGLFTRRYFQEYLRIQTESLVSLPKDSIKRSMAIVMLDIDFFKKVNDTYGHQAGDYVLKNVADIMQHCFRKSDVLCRFGGEEFLVILPNTDAVGAKFVVEKLRRQIENYVFDHEGQVMPITMSCGIAMFKVGEENYEATIARADVCLYKAKQSGRNRVEIDES